MKQESLEKWIQKARASWWEDGLTEILSGIGLTLIAISGILKEHTSGRAADFWGFAWVVILVGFSVGGKFLLQWIKRRWIWPRAGYAHPGSQRFDVRVVPELLLILLVFIALIVWEPPVLTGLLSGLFIFLVLFRIYRYSRIKRFLGYGILALIGGFILAFVRLSFGDALMSVLGLVGVAQLWGGISQFRRFIKMLRQWEAQAHES